MDAPSEAKRRGAREALSQLRLWRSAQVGRLYRHYLEATSAGDARVPPLKSWTDREAFHCFFRSPQAVRELIAAGQALQCFDNQARLRIALQQYVAAHPQGLPARLSDLVGPGLGALSMCPAAGQDVYSSSYWRQSGDRSRLIFCDRHAAAGLREIVSGLHATVTHPPMDAALPRLNALTQLRRGVFSDERAPCYKAFLDPAAFHPGEVVADIGCGLGFFAFEIARRVSPRGRVLALDVERDLLAFVAAVAHRNPGLAVTARRCPQDRVGLPEALIDAASRSSPSRSSPGRRAARTTRPRSAGCGPCIARSAPAAASS
ncbi:MAG: hypothetical protein FJX76_12490 [Armatimonadetes bacterium]|nr:hypothetical protein [Armatimonadota bacterium]